MALQLDPFQKEAIAWINQNYSVLVSAPTGAGKTLIAEHVIDRALEYGENVIYTAPIKALSNQKYRDFRARYADRVGILTGDVSIHPNASILIMTTEIYRNSLFESSERIQKTGWVIFDEIHYLDDWARGTVWEEAILFTPETTRILALSATVPNVKELADWIRSIHNRSIAVVEEAKRPVPLHFFFQCQGKILSHINQLRREGYSNQSTWRVRHGARRRTHQDARTKPNRLDSLLTHLEGGNLLPAIYFVFGRRRTEFLAQEATRFNFLNMHERDKTMNFFDDLLNRYDLQSEKSAQDLRVLVEGGIAYHHAGMLPSLKEVVEQLFTNRLLKLIFTTETFALGINMPARTVVFDELEKFYETGFKHLTTRDFYQMAGRAGRRGMDPEGHVFIRINPHDIPYTAVERILYGNFESIRSQLNTTYATLLNLYKILGEKLLDIYPRTFHHFQSHLKKRTHGFEMISNRLMMLKEMHYIDQERLTPKGEFAASLFGYELYMAEIHTDNLFEDLDEIQLNVLISGFVFEPRKGDHTSKLHHGYRKLAHLAQHYSHQIQRMETKYQITPRIKEPHFNLAAVVEAWSKGSSFEKLFRLTSVDEGELVRHFRMVIQLLRELVHASHASEKLKKTAGKGFQIINRGVVDAERQLRV